MKLFYSICISLLISISSLCGQAQDLLFLKGKHIPLKGNLISQGDQGIGSEDKVYFLRENTRSPRYHKLDKIGAILTKEHKLYIDPARNRSYRSFEDLEYGIIFLTNGKSLAISGWEVVGIEGEIEYVDFFTGEAGRLEEGEFISIYTKAPDLQLFGDLDLTLTRLRTAVLPDIPSLQPVSESEFETPIASNDVEVSVDDEFEAEEDPASVDRISGPAMPVDMDEFNEKAKKKVEKFASYVKTILEGEDRLRIRSVIDQALILFISDTCYIEVSSLNRTQPISYNIRRYFNRLNYLADKYTKIEVTDGKVVKVSDIRKYKDNWYGTVTYGQRFSGYKDGMLVYTDYTQKNINIVLKVYEPEIDGESTAIWDVLLSNISVTETSQ